MTIGVVVGQVQVFTNDLGINFTQYPRCRLTYNKSLRRRIFKCAPFYELGKMQGLFDSKLYKNYLQAFRISLPYELYFHNLSLLTDTLPTEKKGSHTHLSLSTRYSSLSSKIRLNPCKSFPLSIIQSTMVIRWMNFGHSSLTCYGDYLYLRLIVRGWWACRSFSFVQHQ